VLQQIQHQRLKTQWYFELSSTKGLGRGLRKLLSQYENVGNITSMIGVHKAINLDWALTGLRRVRW